MSGKNTNETYIRTCICTLNISYNLSFQLIKIFTSSLSFDIILHHANTENNN